MPNANQIPVVPESVERWRPLAEKWCATYTNLTPNEILAIIWNESWGNPLDVNPHDPSWGLMQVTKLIAHFYGGFADTDTSWQTDPDKNMKCGAGFLADLKRKYAQKFPLDNPSAGWVVAYNEGEGNLRKRVPDPNYQAAYLKHLNALIAAHA